MIRPAPLLLALAIGACSSAVEPVTVVPLGEAFSIGVNELRTVPEAGITLRFVEVLEDSRCPTDERILCFWAGRVRIQLGLTPPIAPELLREVRYQDEPSWTMVGRYRIDFLAVETAKSTNLPALGGYRVRLRVVDTEAPPSP